MKIARFHTHKRRHLVRRKPINALASLMTVFNLYCGIASIFASIGMEFEQAAVFILVGIIFDALDGTVARLTNSTSDFGKELDSLCDIVTFGVAPAVLVFTSYLPDAPTLHLEMTDHTESIIGRTGSYMAILYVICAAWRLARFNTFQAERTDYFTGLPSPAAGGTLASFVLFLGYFESRLDNYQMGPFAYYLLGPMAVICGFLMVSTVRYPKNKMKSFLLAPRRAIIALGVYAVIIVVIHYAVSKSPNIVLFPLGAAYVLYGIGDTLFYTFFKRRPLPVGGDVEAVPVPALRPLEPFAGADSGSNTSSSSSSSTPEKKSEVR